MYCWCFDYCILLYTRIKVDTLHERNQGLCCLVVLTEIISSLVVLTEIIPSIPWWTHAFTTRPPLSSASLIFHDYIFCCISSCLVCCTSPAHVAWVRWENVVVLTPEYRSPNLRIVWSVVLNVAHVFDFAVYCYFAVSYTDSTYCFLTRGQNNN